MIENVSIEEIKLSDYNYHLPEERIAKFPLEKRDDSKLLHFQNGIIKHLNFTHLPEEIPSESMMIFNNTKVIPARLFFQRKTGAQIEIFLLNPVLPSSSINEIMINEETVSWKTMIGGLSKWKDNEVLEQKLKISGEEIILSAQLLDRLNKIVKFSWTGQHVPFVKIVESSGEVPLPPYLNREVTAMDKPRYQTVYSEKEGAVAAPTAGLHFTEQVLNQLKLKKIQSEFITLHVSAGTFQPISHEKVTDHQMHSEQMVFKKEVIKKIANHQKLIINVGTTSLRSMESLFWFGVMLLKHESQQFYIPKLYPYQKFNQLPGRKESLMAVVEWMEKNSMEEITGSTEIFIMPSYEFKMCDAIITNFHQPASTLILLVAAITKGAWKKIYQSALENDYRFLSYGDSSLLWVNQSSEVE
jgi:S-adenosylmethionine:tRNA ribosyltransferase-isomerase